MFRKFIYVLFVAAGLIIIAYVLQPAKKGKGSGITTRYEFVKGWPDLPDGLESGTLQELVSTQIRISSYFTGQAESGL